MREILVQLNKVQGVRGSMVTNRDGIVVASDFSLELDEKGLGAVASSLLTALEAALRRVHFGKLQRFVVKGNEGKTVVADAGPALLLVLLKPEVNMGMVNHEIATALQAIRDKTKMA
jgi:predicted regulator of Ras-like GTPase activity (Roadblock/LC7/MglB family)